MREENRQQNLLDWSPFSKQKGQEDLAKDAQKARLDFIAAELRLEVMKMMIEAEYGHPASCLGLCDLMSVLYFGNQTHYNAQNPLDEDRDRIIFSCGHYSALAYTTLAKAGFFEKDRLYQYTKKDGLAGHLYRQNPQGIEISAGSLGQGVSLGVGIAMALKEKNKNVFLITSDGEQQEGQVWEAYLAAIKFNLSNLTIFIDCNGIQNTASIEEIMPLKEMSKRFKAFGFHVISCDGNDVLSLLKAIKKAKEASLPSVILIHTVAGKGVPFMENSAKWHSDLPQADLRQSALKTLQEAHAKARSWQRFLSEMV